MELGGQTNHLAPWSTFWRFSQAQEVDVPPGETVVVELGRTGDDAQGCARWNLSEPVIVSGTLSTLPPALPGGGFASTADAEAWANSASVPEAQQRHRFYGAVVQPDGALRLEGVD